MQTRLKTWLRSHLKFTQPLSLATTAWNAPASWTVREASLGPRSL
jgi:hypothetical protein